MIASIAPLLPSAGLNPVSRCLLHFRASDGENEDVGRQAATFVRGTTATIADAALNTFSIGYTQPAWETLPWLGATQSMFLRMNTSDRFHFACGWRPQALAFYHEFRQNGAISSSGGALWSIANDAVSGARMRMYSNGTQYVLEHHNGSTARDVGVGSAPANGDSVIHWGYLFANGSVRFYESINGAAATATAATSASSLASTWGATPRVRLSANGTTAGFPAFHRVFKLVPGLPSFEQLVRAF